MTQNNWDIIIRIILSKKNVVEQKYNKKEIKVIEYSEDIVKFVRNLIYPNEVQKIYKEDSIVFIEEPNNVIKGRIYGRDRKNLYYINEILKKYFSLELKIKWARNQED